MDIEKITKKINISLKENELYSKSIKILGIEPEPFSRPRSTSRSNFHYNPREKFYKKLKKLYEEELKDFKKINGEVYIETKIYITPPLSILNSPTKRLAAKMEILKPITRPDLDNYEKANIDCFYMYFMNDDSQIVSSKSEKFYAIDREPGYEMEILYREEKLKFK